MILYWLKQARVRTASRFFFYCLFVLPLACEHVFTSGAMEFILKTGPARTGRGSLDVLKALPEKPPVQQELRKHLRDSFIVEVNDRKRLDGVDSVILADDAQTLYRRLRREGLAYHDFVLWGEQHAGKTVPHVAVLTWIGLSSISETQPQSKRLKLPAPFLPDSFLDGLNTAAKCFDCVEFLKYAADHYDTSAFPSNVTFVEAESYVPFEVVKSRFAKGVGLRLIADVLRAKHLRHRGGGYFVDGDTLWVARPPPLVVEPPSYGHSCATLPRPHGALRLSKPELVAWDQSYFLASPQDQVYPGSPMCFPAESPILDSWIQSMDEDVVKPAVAFKPKGHHAPRMKWDAVRYNMMLMQDAFSKYGNVYAYLRSHVFSPIRIEHSAYVIRDDKAHLFDVPEIGKSSIGINNFWAASQDLDSANRSGRHEELIKHSGLARIGKQSAWSELRKLVDHRASLRKDRKGEAEVRQGPCDVQGTSSGAGGVPSEREES